MEKPEKDESQWAGRDWKFDYKQLLPLRFHPEVA